MGSVELTCPQLQLIEFLTEGTHRTHASRHRVGAEARPGKRAGEVTVSSEMLSHRTLGPELAQECEGSQ